MAHTPLSKGDILEDTIDVPITIDGTGEEIGSTIVIRKNIRIDRLRSAVLGLKEEFKDDSEYGRAHIKRLIDKWLGNAVLEEEKDG